MGGIVFFFFSGYTRCCRRFEINWVVVEINPASIFFLVFDISISELGSLGSVI